MRRLWLVLGFLFLLLAANRSVSLQAETAGVTRGFHSGWNLVALPPATVLSGVQRLYTFQPGDSDYETLEPGQGSTAGLGYWAYFSENTALSLAPGDSSPYSVSVAAGEFIMIGNPSGSLPATVSGADAVYTYDPTNGYRQTTTLLQGEGAWAMSTNDGTIRVTPAAAATSSAAPQPSLALSGAAPTSLVASPPAPTGSSDNTAAGLGAANAMASDQVSVTPDADDPRFLTVTSSWGYQVDMPADWVQLPPLPSDVGLVAQFANGTFDTFAAPGGGRSLGIMRLPTHPPGYDALSDLKNDLAYEQSQSDAGKGVEIDFQLLQAPEAIAVPNADSAAVAETSSKTIIWGTTSLQRHITAYKGDATYDFIIIWDSNLPSDALLPTNFQLLP